MAIPQKKTAREGPCGKVNPLTGGQAMKRLDEMERDYYRSLAEVPMRRRVKGAVAALAGVALLVAGVVAVVYGLGLLFR